MSWKYGRPERPNRLTVRDERAAVRVETSGGPLQLCRAFCSRLPRVHHTSHVMLRSLVSGQHHHQQQDHHGASASSLPCSSSSSSIAASSSASLHAGQPQDHTGDPVPPVVVVLGGVRCTSQSPAGQKAWNIASLPMHALDDVIVHSVRPGEGAPFDGVVLKLPIRVAAHASVAIDDRRIVVLGGWSSKGLLRTLMVVTLHYAGDSECGSSSRGSLGSGVGGVGGGGGGGGALSATLSPVASPTPGSPVEGGGACGNGDSAAAPPPHPRPPRPAPSRFSISTEIVEPLNKQPVHRMMHTACTATMQKRQLIIAFGGMTVHPQAQHDAGGGEGGPTSPTPAMPVGGAPHAPPPDPGPQYAFFGGQMYLCNILEFYDVRSSQVVSVDYVVANPDALRPRCSAASCALASVSGPPGSEGVAVYGGLSATSETLDDMWVLTPQSHLATLSFVWREVRFPSRAAPGIPRRLGHAMVSITHNKVLVVGGSHLASAKGPKAPPVHPAERASLERHSGEAEAVPLPHHRGAPLSPRSCASGVSSASSNVCVPNGGTVAWAPPQPQSPSHEGSFLLEIDVVALTISQVGGDTFRPGAGLMWLSLCISPSPRTLWCWGGIAGTKAASAALQACFPSIKYEHFDYEAYIRSVPVVAAMLIASGCVVVHPPAQLLVSQTDSVASASRSGRSLLNAVQSSQGLSSVNTSSVASHGVPPAVVEKHSHSHGGASAAAAAVCAASACCACAALLLRPGGHMPAAPAGDALTVDPPASPAVLSAPSSPSSPSLNLSATATPHCGTSPPARPAARPRGASTLGSDSEGGSSPDAAALPRHDTPEATGELARHPTDSASGGDEEEEDDEGFGTQQSWYTDCSANDTAARGPSPPGAHRRHDIRVSDLVDMEDATRPAHAGLQREGAGLLDTEGVVHRPASPVDSHRSMHSIPREMRGQLHVAVASLDGDPTEDFPTRMSSGGTSCTYTTSDSEGRAPDPRPTATTTTATTPLQMGGAARALGERRGASLHGVGGRRSDRGSRRAEDGGRRRGGRRKHRSGKLSCGDVPDASHTICVREVSDDDHHPHPHQGEQPHLADTTTTPTAPTPTTTTATAAAADGEGSLHTPSPVSAAEGGAGAGPPPPPQPAASVGLGESRSSAVPLHGSSQSLDVSTFSLASLFSGAARSASLVLSSSDLSASPCDAPAQPSPVAEQPPTPPPAGASHTNSNSSTELSHATKSCSTTEGRTAREAVASEESQAFPSQPALLREAKSLAERGSGQLTKIIGSPLFSGIFSRDRSPASEAKVPATPPQITVHEEDDASTATTTPPSQVLPAGGGGLRMRGCDPSRAEMEVPGLGDVRTDEDAAMRGGGCDPSRAEMVMYHQGDAAAVQVAPSEESGTPVEVPAADFIRVTSVKAEEGVGQPRGVAAAAVASEGSGGFAAPASEPYSAIKSEGSGNFAAGPSIRVKAVLDDSTLSFTVKQELSWQGFLEVLVENCKPLLEEVGASGICEGGDLLQHTKLFWIDDDQDRITLSSSVHYQSFTEHCLDRTKPAGKIEIDWKKGKAPQQEDDYRAPPYTPQQTPPPQVHSVTRSGSDAEVDAAATPGPQHQQEGAMCWREGRLIGKGSYGEVYQALEASGRIIAVKKIPVPDGQMGSVEREIDLLKRLDHPNIVKLLGTDRLPHAHCLCILMEYLSGGSLAAMARQYGSNGTGLNMGTIQVYTRQILAGLEYLHSNHVVHRDVKGDNILVDQNGNCKLGDFGASKIISQTSSVEQISSGLRGTILFFAPEIVRDMQYSFLSDMWALGCTLIEMATGGPPWHDWLKQKRPNQWLIHKHVEANPVPPFPTYSVPESFRDMLSLCLKVTPSDRPSAAALADHPFLTETFVPGSANEPMTRASTDCFLGTPSEFSTIPIATISTAPPTG